MSVPSFHQKNLSTCCHLQCSLSYRSHGSGISDWSKTVTISGPDPGFSVGGGAWAHFGGGFWPPTWALFSENLCKNERIGSCRGGACAGTPPQIRLCICTCKKARFRQIGAHVHIQTSTINLLIRALVAR